MKKKTFKQHGFTLVELVVVIAIIGVLAAILVPSMLNYVKKSRLRSANTNAKTAYNAVASYVAEQEVKGKSKSEVIDEYNDEEIPCTGSEPAVEAQREVFDFLAENGVTSGIVYVGTAEINGVDDCYFVQWTGDKSPNSESTDTVFGQYPNAITWDAWTEKKTKWCEFYDPNA